MSKKADIWMPLYIGDYLADTMHLTTEQHGAYLLLLMHYWRAGSLPADDRALAQIARCSEHAWSNAKPVLEQFFTVCPDGRWRQKRIEEELAAAREKKVAREEKARKAAEARWGNADSVDKYASSNASSNAADMLEDCPSPSPSPSPLPLHSKSETPENKMSRVARDDVVSIFDHWRQTMEHDKARLDDKRRKLIRNALSLGYSVADLQQAITGYSLSPFHMGMNDNGRRYDGLDLILRNAEKIDAGIEFYRNPPKLKGKQARIEAINDQAMQDFLNGVDPFAPARPEPIDVTPTDIFGDDHA